MTDASVDLLLERRKEIKKTLVQNEERFESYKKNALSAMQDIALLNKYLLEVEIGLKRLGYVEKEEKKDG